MNSTKHHEVTAGGRKYRFCVVCRGDDQPLVYCHSCSQPYHFECAELKFDERYESGTTITRKDWLCIDCVHESKNESTQKVKLSAEEKAVAKALNKRISFCKESARNICKWRKSFITDHRKLLEPFCAESTLDRLCVGTEIQRSATIINGGYHKVSPSYITVKVRDYQLEGINRMYDWYNRGVGGILADEM